jgi:hypothetical protein
VLAAENQIGGGTGTYWAGELGYPVTSDNPIVRQAIAQAICARYPNWCLVAGGKNAGSGESLLGQFKNLLNAIVPLIGGLEGDSADAVPSSGSLDAMSASGQAEDRNGLTMAGRGYQKHMDRGELPRVPGTQLNTVGQNLLDDIDTVWRSVSGGSFKGGIYLIMPNGSGAAFGADLQFRYFGIFTP